MYDLTTARILGLLTDSHGHFILHCREKHPHPFTHVDQMYPKCMCDRRAASVQWVDMECKMVSIQK
jgi:hypothetical protein